VSNLHYFEENGDRFHKYPLLQSVLIPVLIEAWEQVHLAIGAEKVIFQKELSQLPPIIYI
jgi:hypothetical protein